MKHLFKHLFLAIACLLVGQSCLDKGYAWDDLDKNGEFNLPMVPLGNFDTIYFEGLPELPQLPPELGGVEINAKFAVADTIKGIFDEDVSKNFFYEGKTTDVYINGQFDRIDFPKNVTFKIALAFEVLGEDKKPIPVIIPPVQLFDANGTPTSQLKIVIGKDYMKEMKDARHLTVTVAVDANLTLDDLKNSKSAFQLREMKLYTGSVAFEF